MGVVYTTCVRSEYLSSRETTVQSAHKSDWLHCSSNNAFCDQVAKLLEKLEKLLAKDNADAAAAMRVVLDTANSTDSVGTEVPQAERSRYALDQLSGQVYTAFPPAIGSHAGAGAVVRVPGGASRQQGRGGGAAQAQPLPLPRKGPNCCANDGGDAAGGEPYGRDRALHRHRARPGQAACGPEAQQQHQRRGHVQRAGAEGGVHGGAVVRHAPLRELERAVWRSGVRPALPALRVHHQLRAARPPGMCSLQLIPASGISSVKSSDGSPPRVCAPATSSEGSPPRVFSPLSSPPMGPRLGYILPSFL
eukprot:8712996-Pyramimonas_sp.AAC.2